jgi:hypothetical protein
MPNKLKLPSGLSSKNIVEQYISGILTLLTVPIVLFAWRKLNHLLPVFVLNILHKQIKILSLNTRLDQILALTLFGIVCYYLGYQIEKNKKHKILNINSSTFKETPQEKSKYKKYFIDYKDYLWFYKQHNADDFNLDFPPYCKKDKIQLSESNSGIMLSCNECNLKIFSVPVKQTLEDMRSILRTQGIKYFIEKGLTTEL